MASLQQIADQSGCSAATVSRVLNGRGQVRPETRVRVLSVARQLGHQISRNGQKLSRVALVYPGRIILAEGGPYDAAFVRGISAAMAERDFDLTIIGLRRSLRPDESVQDLFRRKGVSAVILRSDDDTLQICEQIAATGIPSVMIGERSDDPAISYVDCSTRAASAEVVEHLIGLGHTRIAFCVNTILTSDHRDRFEGWRSAMQAHGLEAAESLVIRLPAYTADNGATLLRRLTTMPNRPTAVFVADPLLAFGAIREAPSLGIRIPDDLSIAGTDDSDLRLATTPRMTAVCQDAADLGHRAIAILAQMVEGGDDSASRVETEAWVEVHASTGPAPGRTIAAPAGDGRR